MDSKLRNYILIRLSILVSILYLFSFLAYRAYADEVYTGAMVGVFNSGKKSLSETKFVNLGVRQDIIPGLVQQFEGGGWVDIAGDGRKDSLYGAYQLGVEASHIVTARVMAGPAIVTTPDAMLGGPFAFTEDFFLGIRGDEGATVGLKYKHISNAGLEPPNVGRDFMGVEAAIHF